MGQFLTQTTVTKYFIWYFIRWEFMLKNVNERHWGGKLEKKKNKTHRVKMERPSSGYPFSSIDITNYHKLSGLKKQQKFVLSQFWQWEVWSPGEGKGVTARWCQRGMSWARGRALGKVWNNDWASIGLEFGKPGGQYYGKDGIDWERGRCQGSSGSCRLFCVKLWEGNLENF